jgi:hypothetical protein
MRFIETDDFTNVAARCIERIQRCKPLGKVVDVCVGSKEHFLVCAEYQPRRASIAARHFRDRRKLHRIGAARQAPRIAQALASKAAAKLRFVVVLERGNLDAC